MCFAKATRHDVINPSCASLGHPSQRHQPTLGHFLFEALPCAVSLCVPGAVRRDFDVAQSSKICAHAVSLRVQHFRALFAAPFLSFESCMCAVHACACSRCSQLRVVRVRCFFACGGLTYVEHCACPRLSRVGGGSVFVFARVFLIGFMFVGGVFCRCSWWRLQSVRRVSLCFSFNSPRS